MNVDGEMDGKINLKMFQTNVNQKNIKLLQPLKCIKISIKHYNT